MAPLVSESFGPADPCDASVLAIDLALLLPPDADALARRLNQTLATDPDALRLDDAHLPHVTVAQLFIAAEDLDNVRERVMPAVAGMGRLRLHVRGIARGSSAWMEIERTAELQQLHERLMDALEPLERRLAAPSAFYSEGGESPRPQDIAWVAGFRLRSSYANYCPHVTLGHGGEDLRVEPFEFHASRFALCHLGRFCTCRLVLHEWRLGATPP